MWQQKTIVLFRKPVGLCTAPYQFYDLCQWEHRVKSTIFDLHCRQQNFTTPCNLYIILIDNFWQNPLYLFRSFFLCYMGKCQRKQKWWIYTQWISVSFIFVFLAEDEDRRKETHIDCLIIDLLSNHIKLNNEKRYFKIIDRYTHYYMPRDSKNEF